MKKIIFASCIIPLALTSCLVGREVRSFTDYTAEGFLNDNIYQFLVQGKPEDSDHTLLHKRTSALSKARSSKIEYCLNALLQHCNAADGQKSPADMTKIDRYAEKKEFIREALLDDIKDGYGIVEYFKEDKSAVIVYRVYSRDLKEKVKTLCENLKNPRRAEQKPPQEK